jgi:Tol biopolymer transport system component
LSSLVCASLLLSAGPALAFHRDLSAVTAITLSGDQDLPRIPPQGRKVMVMAFDTGAATTPIVSLHPFTSFAAQTPLSPAGSVPAVSYDGRTFAWVATDDPLDLGLPGSQIVLERDGSKFPGPADPSGTSGNPSLDKRGRILVFESAGNLNGLGAPGIDAVYVYDSSIASLQLASSGQGPSGQAMVSAKGNDLAFVSTSDPTTGLNTGISQIWVGTLKNLPAHRVTNGVGHSTEPLVSDEGRLVAFSSTSALATDGHDTGVKQIFIYDDRTQTSAQLTNEPGGCHRPAVSRVRSDWRVSFVCSGQAYFHMVRENKRYHLLTPGGVAQSILPEMGVHFVMVSTTSNLYDGSTLAGNRIFLRNLFADPAPETPGSAIWFPYQGIPGF